MICWMLHPADGRWTRFSSISAARDRFRSDADNAINRWGQEEYRWCEAWVVIAVQRPSDGDAYPDRIFKYDPDRDRVTEERT